MKTEPITPKEKKAELRKRLEAVVPKLPDNWISLFVYVHPEFVGKKSFLSNVRCGQSLDENVITKMEKLAESLTKIKNNHE